MVVFLLDVKLLASVGRHNRHVGFLGIALIRLGRHLHEVPQTPGVSVKTTVPLISVVFLVRRGKQVAGPGTALIFQSSSGS